MPVVQRISLLKRQKKDFSYYKLNLGKDADFNKVLESVFKIGEFIDDTNTQINVDLNIDQFNKNLLSAKQKSNQIAALSGLTNRPDYLFKLIEEKYAMQQEFVENNPEFLKLSESEQKALIDNVVSIRMDNARNKRGICSDQWASDVSYCHARQYTAAAFCGLLSPTLVGALGCGVAVVVDSAICHSQADENFELCLDATY